MEKWARPDRPWGEPDRGYGAGFGLTALACAYSWLYADWSPQDWVLSFSSGSRLNRRAIQFLTTDTLGLENGADHARADQNSFTLFLRGERLIRPAGYEFRTTRWKLLIVS